MWMFTFECRPIGHNLCPVYVHLLHGIGHPGRLASGRDGQLALDCRRGGCDSGQPASPDHHYGSPRGSICQCERAEGRRTCRQDAFGGSAQHGRPQSHGANQYVRAAIRARPGFLQPGIQGRLRRWKQPSRGECGASRRRRNSSGSMLNSRAASSILPHQWPTLARRRQTMDMVPGRSIFLDSLAGTRADRRLFSWWMPHTLGRFWCELSSWAVLAHRKSHWPICHRPISPTSLLKKVNTPWRWFRLSTRLRAGWSCRQTLGLPLGEHGSGG